MKSLWRKANLARCGDCRSCSTLVGGFGHRVTAAPRRNPTFVELFTACYSSVLASAAVIDSVRKDDRRRDLDRQLDEARAELEGLQEPLPVPRRMNTEHDVAWLTEIQMDEVWRTLKAIWISRPYMKEIHQPATPSESELLATLQTNHYGCRDKESMTALRWTNLNRLERSMIFEESEPSVPRRDPIEPRHLNHYTNTICSMIQQLMQRAEQSVKTPEYKGSMESPSFKAALELLARGYPRYMLSKLDIEGARQNTIRLNDANRAVLKNRDLPLMEKIGQICYNILISVYPPDMHSFNALILGFDRIHGFRPFSDIIIYNFIYKTYLKPSPTTHAAILYHTKVTTNHLKFLETISRMVGLDGVMGAKVKTTHVDRVAENTALWRWAADTRWRTLTGDHIWDHAPLNRLIVEEAISGFLRFHMFESAVLLLTTCLRTGVLISTRYINLVLEECLLSLDWPASVRLIRDLTKHDEIWPAMIGLFGDKTAARVINRIYSILDMIGLGVSTVQISEEGLANMGISGHELAKFLIQVQRSNLALPESLMVDPRRGAPSLSDAERASRSRLLQYESLLKECERVEKNTRSIESKLLNSYHLPRAFCATMALHIGNKALESSQQLAVEAIDTIINVQTTRKSKGRISPTAHMLWRKPRGRQGAADKGER